MNKVILMGNLTRRPGDPLYSERELHGYRQI